MIPELVFDILMLSAVDPAIVKKVLTNGLQRLIAAEPDVTNYDTIAGDGDCGIGLKRGAEGQHLLVFSGISSNVE